MSDFDAPSSSSNPHRLVRVQDDLHGMRKEPDGVFMPNDRHRNTVHFAFDGVVSDHAYGSFNVGADGALKGKIVVIADPAEMAKPSGLNQVDTWFRKEDRTNPLTGAQERGISVGNATIVAPAGTAPVEGAQMVFYDGSLVDRDLKVKAVLERAGVEPQEIGFRSWSNTTKAWGMIASIDWAKSTATELYGSNASSIHIGMHDSSADDSLDSRSGLIRYHLQELKSGEEWYFDSSQVCDVRRADSIRNLVGKQIEELDQTLSSLPASERARCGSFFEQMKADSHGVLAETIELESGFEAARVQRAVKSEVNELPGSGPFYLAKPNSQEYKAISDDELSGGLLSKEIGATDRAWRNGMHAEWRTIQDLLPDAHKRLFVEQRQQMAPGFDDVRQVAHKAIFEAAEAQTYTGGGLKPLVRSEAGAKSGISIRP